jgi:hypothetical protein
MAPTGRACGAQTAGLQRVRDEARRCRR